MTYEHEIPAYAMQVAKAPKTMPCPAVYHTETLMSPGERQSIQYQFEEDILVPDTKDDMEEILLMTADCDVLPAERKLSPKADEFLNFTGTVTIQTLYRAETESSMPVSITSKVPYQYQWQLHCGTLADAMFQCKVKSLEYMIINERKFRVKVILELSALLFAEQTVSLFQGLEEEPLEMKTETLSLCSLGAIKKEMTEIDAWTELPATKAVPLELLQQQFTISENYRQVTSEKIVLNGFLFAEFMYRGRKEDEEEILCTHKERIEFTQFLPLEKHHRGRNWSLVKTEFCNNGLHAALEKKEDGQMGFHIEGSLKSHIYLYNTSRQEMVTDAYHQRKHFTCRFQRQSRKDMACVATGEITFRELIHLPDGGMATDAVCCQCRPVRWQCQGEKGRLRVQAEVESLCLWKGEGGYKTTRYQHKITGILEADEVTPDMELQLSLQTKECRLALLTENQLEVTGNLFVCCDGYQEKELLLLTDPVFTEVESEKRPAMVVASVEAGETLWNLAKRHRTTEEKIRRVNHLDGELESGKKILIIR